MFWSVYLLHSLSITSLLWTVCPYFPRLTACSSLTLSIILYDKVNKNDVLHAICQQSEQTLAKHIYHISMCKYVFCLTLSEKKMVSSEPGVRFFARVFKLYFRPKNKYVLKCFLYLHVQHFLAFRKVAKSFISLGISILNAKVSWLLPTIFPEKKPAKEIV